ncbi:hypothetical protein ACLMJK_005297 [Lecanora helva]
MSQYCVVNGISRGLAPLEQSIKNGDCTLGSTTITGETSRKRHAQDEPGTGSPRTASRPRLDAFDAEVNSKRSGHDPSVQHSKIPRVNHRDAERSTSLSCNTNSNGIPGGRGWNPVSSTDASQQAAPDIPVNRDAVNLVAASSNILQPWNRKHEADQVLFDMWNAGQSWSDIEKVWRQLTGEDTSAAALADRYNRLTNETQRHVEGDDASLFDAVEEVMTAFKRDKWRFVSEAMARRGISKYSAAQCKQRYKELVRTSQNTTATEDSAEKTADPEAVPGGEPHVANSAVSSSPAIARPPVQPSPASSNQSTRHISAEDGTHAQASSLHSNTDKDPNSHGLSGRAQNTKNGDSISNEKESAPQNRVESGSLPTNAIVLEDSDGEIFTFPTVKAQKTSSSTVKSPVSSKPPVDQPSNTVGSNATATQPNKDRSTISRVGSVTNRGPARFTSFRKHTDEDALRKPKTSHKSLSNTAKVARDKALMDRNSSQMNKALPAQHHEQASESSGKSERQQQQQELAQPKDSLEQPERPSSEALPVIPRSQLLPQPPTTESKTFISELTPKPLFNTRPPSVRSPEHLENLHQQSSSEQIAKPLTGTASTPITATDDPSLQTQDSGKLKKAISKQQLECMVGNKQLDGPNGNKSWDVIAKECGMTATTAEISKALEENGFSSIFERPTTTSTFVNPAAQRKSPEARPYALPLIPMTPAEASNAVIPSPAAETLANPSPISETPATPAFIPSENQKNPMTGSKRGPGRPRKESSATSSFQSPHDARKFGKTPQQRAKIGEGMKASWARRKGNAFDVRDDAMPTPGTMTPSNKTQSSAAALAAQILAAVDAQEANQAVNRVNNATLQAEPQDDEPRDVLTGETMFAHVNDYPIPIRGIPAPQPKGKKIRGPYKKKAISTGGKKFLKYHTPSSSKDDRPRHACEKCGKSYLQSVGLNYHRQHHPNCDTEPKKRDSRTDPSQSKDILENIEPPTTAVTSTTDHHRSRYPCEKCGKSYVDNTGLKYHRQHHPSCDIEPKKRDQRTNPQREDMDNDVEPPAMTANSDFRPGTTAANPHSHYAPVARMKADPG